MKLAFSAIPTHSSVTPAPFSVIPAKAGIQTGGLTAETQRRRERRREQSARGGNRMDCRRRLAMAKNSALSLRLCVSAVNRYSPQTTCLFPWTPAFAGVTRKGTGVTGKGAVVTP